MIVKAFYGRTRILLALVLNLCISLSKAQTDVPGDAFTAMGWRDGILVAAEISGSSKKR
jgi:hypothetical protein